MTKKSMTVENKSQGVSVDLPESLIDQDQRWDEIIKELITLYRNSPYWIFRGQHNWDYSLRTTIERRKLDRAMRKGFYGRLITMFQEALNLYSDIENVPTREELLETQALMQHYGCPTTLLDWTSSPYIAAYFATNDASLENDADASIFALNRLPFEYILRKYLVSKKLIEDEFNFFLSNEPQVFKKIVSFNLSTGEGFILPVVPKNKNERMYLQQGYFTVNGNIYYGFEENLAIMLDYGMQERIISKETMTEILIKIRIPRKEKPRIQEDLLLMNITSATLFPDLDGYSKSFDQYLIRDKNKIEDFFDTISKGGKLAL